MSMAPKIEELRRLSDNDLIKTHDEIARHTVVGLNYYLDEIMRRDQDRFLEKQRLQNEQMLTYTRWMTVMTVVVTIATIAALVIAVVK